MEGVLKNVHGQLGVDPSMENSMKIIFNFCNPSLTFWKVTKERLKETYQWLEKSSEKLVFDAKIRQFALLFFRIEFTVCRNSSVFIN